MAAYLIAHIHVGDPAQFEKYRAEVPAVIEQFGGRYIVRGGPAVGLEGNYDGHRIVVIEFPSLAAAQTFWKSPEYAAVRKLREGAAKLDVIAVEGL
jgi:uncharacterized protein (DUF1330 family)